VNPEETIRRRLEKVAGNKLSSADWERVSRTLPPALFREAARRWFPQLQQELAQQANQRPPREASLLQPEVFRNEKHVAQEMLAENPLAKLKPTVAKAPSVIPGVTWWNQKETLTKTKASAPAKSDSLSKEIVDAPTEPPAKKPRGELLAVNPLRDLLQRSPEQAASPQLKAPQSLSSALPEDAASVPSSRVVEVPSEPVAVANNPPPADTIDLVNHGAWFLDESSLSVRYRPRGHADEWLQLVLNAAAASQSQPPPQRASLFAKTLSETAFQSCASCHSIEQTTTTYRLHWQAGRRDLSRREFTKFSHRPHTLQPQLENCTHCHAVNANAQAMLNYETPHPKRIVDDFHPLQKASCIACHSSATDGGRCTLCHNYHVGAKKHPGH
jgi:hypothetical protein